MDQVYTAAVLYMVSNRGCNTVHPRYGRLDRNGNYIKNILVEIYYEKMYCNAGLFQRHFTIN